MHCDFCNATDHTVHTCAVLAEYGGAVVIADDMIEIDAAVTADVMAVAIACGVAMDGRGTRRHATRERDEFMAFVNGE